MNIHGSDRQCILNRDCAELIGAIAAICYRQHGIKLSGLERIGRSAIIKRDTCGKAYGWKSEKIGALFVGVEQADHQVGRVDQPVVHTIGIARMGKGELIGKAPDRGFTCSGKLV